jgi:hypothetical protein
MRIPDHPEGFSSELRRFLESCTWTPDEPYTITEHSTNLARGLRHELPWPVVHQSSFSTIRGREPDHELAARLRNGPLAHLHHPVPRARLWATFFDSDAVEWIDRHEDHASLEERHTALAWAGLASLWRFEAPRSDTEWVRAFRERPELALGALGAAHEHAWLLRDAEELAVETLHRWSPRPRVLERELFDAALGRARTIRGNARRVLEGSVEPTRVQAVLDDPNAGRRAAAASWLPQLLGAAAKEPLLARFACEKVAEVREALLEALERVGVRADSSVRADALIAAELKRAGKLPLPPWLEPAVALPLRWLAGC